MHDKTYVYESMNKYPTFKSSSEIFDVEVASPNGTWLTHFAYLYAQVLRKLIVQCYICKGHHTLYPKSLPATVVDE